MDKDQKLISEAYKKVLNEAYGYGGIKKTWHDDSKSGTWDGEVKLHRNPKTGSFSNAKYKEIQANPELYKNDPLFYVNVKYDLDYTYDAGDYDTPPDLTINNIDFVDYTIDQEDPETGEWKNVTNELEKTNPELFKGLMNVVDEEIASIEYERL